MSSTTDFASETTNVPVHQIQLSSGANCLVLSPMQLASLAISGALKGANDGTGLNCRSTNTQTGQESEMQVFKSAEVKGADWANQSEQLTGLCKLLKTTSSELAQVNWPSIDGQPEPSDDVRKIFDNIQAAVATCGSPSRFCNHCYLTGRKYTDAEAETQLTGRHFSGARALYGERWYLVSFHFAKSLEHLFPVVDAWFNIVHHLVPLVAAFPGLKKKAGSRAYLKCQIRRKNGSVQTGCIWLDRFQMLEFKSRFGEPRSVYITVRFNMNGADVQDVELKTSSETRPDASPSSETRPKTSSETRPETSSETRPEPDAYKCIKLSDFLTENPDFLPIFGTSELSFEMLTLQLLSELIQGGQL